MPYVNTKLLKRIPEQLRGVMEYYPDVSLFELNHTQYTYLWRELSSAKYLYTNGYEIQSTNWFVYALETVKGWFGFDNACQPEKITYTLNKLAYYGYTQQFHQPDFSLMTDYSIVPEIAALVVKKYDDPTTAQLQAELVRDYFNVEPFLTIENFNQRLHPRHRFGDSWVRVQALEQIPLLDPQDESLIVEVIKALDQPQTIPLLFLKQSKYARIAAQYYCDKANNTVVPSFLFRLLWNDPRPGYLTAALAYDSEIGKKDTQKFIEYHLQQKEYLNAFNLLGLLNDPKLVLKFLLAIPEIDRNNLIKKDTPLAAIMAKHHLEQKQYILAQQLYSNIEELSPTAAFTIAIQEQNHLNAYEIFKRHESTTPFSMPERTKLATIFFTGAEAEYEAGKTCRDCKKWQEAGQHYLQSLVQKKMAHHLNPSEEYLEDVYTHKRLYGQLLIDADIDLHLPENSEVASILKAITLLRECHSNREDEQASQTNVLATGLMRRVDTLREKIALPYEHPDHAAMREHKNKHQHELSAFIKTLQELITLLEKTQDEALLLKLGKAHYLLADVQEFFDITTVDSSDINKHYKMAMQAVPANPFYVLRVSEIFENERDQLQHIGVPLLKKMGYGVHDFDHWSQERWFKREEMIYEIKDIHQSPSIIKSGHSLSH